MKNRRCMFANTLIAAAVFAAIPALAQDEPAEYRDRTEHREAWRRGYDQGFERGYRKGLEEGERRAAAAIAPPAPVAGPIRVSSAFYGSGSKNCNATHFVARHADGRRSHSFEVTNNICGDPAKGDRKSLEVSYLCGSIAKTASAFEHRSISLDCN